MRIWIWIALTSACGPMHPAPSPPPATPAGALPAGDPAGFAAAPDPTMPPGALAPGDADADGDGDGDDAVSDDSYAAVKTAAPVRARRGAPAGDATVWVEAHNRLRARHCAPALSWSARLAEVAQRWANTLRDRGCTFGHSGGSFGENLAAGTSGTLDPESVVRMWYDEVAQYRFPDGGFSMKTGHFTQLVWRGTREVGCARSQCKGMDIFVCEYNPAGNWEGQYRDNVLPRGCR
jgi:Cysteine-rich secretory protein family